MTPALCTPCSRGASECDCSGESDWIEWTGGDCPARGHLVDVRTRGTGEWSGWVAEQWGVSWLPEAFEDPDCADAIIAYRVVPPAPEAAREEGEELKQVDAGWLSQSLESAVLRMAAGRLLADVVEAIKAGRTEEEIRASLRPQAPATAPDAEPVAWRWRFDDDGLTNWYFGPVATPGNKGAQRSMMEPVEVQPLYVRPAPATAPSDVDGAVDAWRAKAAVLRSRGRGNTAHDIEQAADYLDAAARALTEAREQARLDGEALEAVVIEADREQGRWQHLKRVIALTARKRLAARTGGA